MKRIEVYSTFPGTIFPDILVGLNHCNGNHL